VSGTWQIHGSATLISSEQNSLEEVLGSYASALPWPEGRRLPDESRFVHRIADRALRAAGVASRTLGGAVGIVLASPFGGLTSYERFQASLTDPAGVQPMAFSFALPGIPVSMLSLYYGITGPVTHLSTASGVEAAVVVLGMLESGLCERVIAGSWYFPSATARECGGPEEARAALAVIGASSAERSGPMIRFEATPINQSALCSDDLVWHAALCLGPISRPLQLTATAGTLVLSPPAKPRRGGV